MAYVKSQVTVMVLLFLCAGYLLIKQATTAYNVLVRGDVGSARWMRQPPRGRMKLSSAAVPWNGSRADREGVGRPGPLMLLTSSFFLFDVFVAFVCLAGATTIWSLTHEREVKRVTADLKSLYLTGDEKYVIEELELAGGQMTQKELTVATGFTRVKTHRTLQKLEQKQLVRKVPAGQTNRIILEDPAAKSPPE